MAVVIPFPKRTDWEPWLTKRELSSILGFGTRWIEYRVSEGMPSRKIGFTPSVTPLSVANRSQRD
jgi:hypothetical protein